MDPDRYLEQADMMLSLRLPKGDEVESIRPEESKFKGYSVRAHNPEEAGPLEGKIKPVNDKPLFGNPIPNRDAVQMEGVMPGYWFDSVYTKVINLASEYDDFPRDTSTLREEKIALLSRIETSARNYLAKYPLPEPPSDQELKRHIMVNQILNSIAQERRLLFGITREYGKIYLPEDEQDARENFARGNSASIAKVTYKAENPGEKPFVAVFKASTPDQTINAEAAKAFGISDNSENSNNSETAKLSHRSVYFYELDLLMGEELTPPTFYAIHNGQPGSCQQFVEGLHVSERGDVEDRYFAENAEIVPGIVRGEYIDQGRSFRLLNNSPDLEAQLGRMSDDDLIALYHSRDLVLTREQVVDIPPINLSHPKTQKALADAQLLDHLAGSVDRNLSNIFFVPKTGEDEDGDAWYGIQLIDNDLCAAAGNVHDNDKAHSLASPFRINMAGRVPNFIDYSTAERLQAMSFEEVYELQVLHQVSNFPELASQRERLGNCIDTINRALRAFPDKVEVTYKSTEEVAKRDKVTGREIPGQFETRVVESVDEITLVDEWDDETYQQMLVNRDTYLFRANDCRISELGAMMDSNPEKAAEIWVTQFHLMGAGPMAEAYGKDRNAIPKLSAFLNHYRKRVVLEGDADTRRACDFVHTLVKAPKQNLTPDEQQEKSDLLLPMMLGDKATGKDIGRALNFCQNSQLLRASTVMALLPQATKMTADIPADQWEPPEYFKTNFKFMIKDGGFPPVPDRIAVSQCVEGAHPQRESIDMLRFCSLLTYCTVPKYIQINKKLDTATCHEYSHAMKYLTPEALEKIRGTEARNRKALIKRNLFSSCGRLRPEKH
ncbi:hypothetical protein [Endozoicomonas sp. NE40]|uniref:Uncharacterized protein n=1 Tax=Endozoicomonas lisbonensis TaxID=3120522 RepID=A0ABV2SGQ5_9GAMM